MAASTRRSARRSRYRPCGRSAIPGSAEQIEEAHASAVERTVRYMRETVPVVRRRYGAGVVEERAKDLIATEYRHTTARGVSGAEAPDPQLHSHVVITAAVREDDRFVAVASRPVFRAARELGAFYRSALAEELIEKGYEIEPGTGKDGRYFELAGVPRELNEAFSGRSREVARAAERFRARYGRAPSAASCATSRSRIAARRSWPLVATSSGCGRRPLAVTASGPTRPCISWAHLSARSAASAIAERIEASLTGREAVFQARELRAVVLEQSAGELSPDEALAVAREMVRERRVLTLEGGRMTTLAVRAQEQAIERRAAQLSRPAGRDVGGVARENAARKSSERLGAPLNPEQHRALELLSGPERAAMLIGPAGTGKGVVIDAAARAEQHAGREPIGVAVSGSTAERLGADSPALDGRTLTVDALVARANTGAVHVGPDTTVILDEAGMVDHARLDRLTELVERSGAKLIAVGDGKQLPSIGPGGMFDRLADHAPTAQLSDVHRTSDPAERRAWARCAAENPRGRWPTTTLAASSTSETPATRPARPRCIAGLAYREARRAAGRIDRRCLQHGDRPAERSRPIPPRRERRTRGVGGAATSPPLRPARRRPGGIPRPTPPATAAPCRERHPRRGDEHRRKAA